MTLLARDTRPNSVSVRLAATIQFNCILRDRVRFMTLPAHSMASRERHFCKLQMFIKAIFDYLRGKSWFSDPIKKPGLFQYGRELAKFGYGTLFLRTKQATEEAFKATMNTPIRSSGDGVTVSVEAPEASPP